MLEGQDCLRGTDIATAIDRLLKNGENEHGGSLGQQMSCCNKVKTLG